MDWDAHLRMMQEIRKRRYEQLHEVTDRAARLRVAFASQNWDEVEAIKAEVATNAGAEEEVARSVLEDESSGTTRTDPVDPPMSGDE